VFSLRYAGSGVEDQGHDSGAVSDGDQSHVHRFGGDDGGVAVFRFHAVLYEVLGGDLDSGAGEELGGSDGAEVVGVESPRLRLGLQFQQVAAFPYVHRTRGAHLRYDSFGFVDVAAEEVLGLVGFDEIADGSAAGVEAFVDLV
jgi:hypothetical protein